MNIIERSMRRIVVSFIPLLLLFLFAFTHGANGQTVYKDRADISSWAISHITEATEQGFVEGSDGFVYPKRSITRAEFAKLLVTMFSTEPSDQGQIPFSDVKKTDWFYPYVQTAYKENIITGFSDGTFLPQAHITREEMAAMIVRALQIESVPSSLTYADTSLIANWALPYVETISTMNIMEGDGVSFNPKGDATREMAIVVLMRAYKWSGDDEQVPSDENGPLLSSLDALMEKTAQFMLEKTPEPTSQTLGGDWTVIGLARSDLSIPSSFYKTYYTNVVKEVERLMPKTSSKEEGYLDRSKGTEHARAILGLTAIGKSIFDVAGYDLTEALADFEYVTKQGINGPIFALIAFDSGSYEIPQRNDVKKQTTREKLIDWILEREIRGGGWALGQNPKQLDVDMTAMAIQALTPYYDERADVKEAIDRAVTSLSMVQGSNGEFYSWGTSNSESVAQVIVALSSLGIDAHKDERFIKNGRSPVDVLFSFAAPTGGFYHVQTVESANASSQMVDPMATDQAMYALVSYKRFLMGENRLYDMTDV